MKISQETIFNIIKKSLSVLLDECAIPYTEINYNTPIYGTREGINSFRLVRLIVDLEESFETELGVSITIADEKMLSRKNSPFATVQSLTHYLSELVESHNSMA